MVVSCTLQCHIGNNHVKFTSASQQTFLLFIQRERSLWFRKTAEFPIAVGWLGKDTKSNERDKHFALHFCKILYSIYVETWNEFEKFDV